MTDKTFLITDEIPTKTCPLWDATHDPEPGDGMCRIKVLSCRMGGNKYPQAPWLGCATLRDHIRQWHEAVFGARNDKCTLITGEATGTTGVQNLVGLLDAYGLSADYCPNYDATAPGNKRCSLHVGSECEPDDCKVLDRIRKKRKADSEPQAGVCPHVEDRMDGDVCGIDYQENECRQGRDLDIWPYCTKLPNPKEPRHGNVTTFTGQPPVKDPEHARLDYRIGEVGKFLDKHRKRLDILESLHAAAVQNLGERCDDTERKIMGIVGEYGVGLANLNVDLAKRSNLMGERLEAIEQQLGNVTLRSKDMDNRLAALEETISRSVVPRGHIIALDDGLAALEAAVKDLQKRCRWYPQKDPAPAEDKKASVPKLKRCPYVVTHPTLQDECKSTRSDCNFLWAETLWTQCKTFQKHADGEIEKAAPTRCPHASPEPTLVDNKRSFFDCAMTGNKCEEKRCVEGAWRECEHAKGKEAKQKAPAPRWTGDVCPFMGEDKTDCGVSPCLLCEGVTCASWYGTNSNKWPTCGWLKDLCPHFRPPIDDSRIGQCVCDNGKCRLVYAKEWQHTYDTGGNTCRRALGRVRVVKTDKP